MAAPEAGSAVAKAPSSGAAPKDVKQSYFPALMAGLVCGLLFLIGIGVGNSKNAPHPSDRMWLTDYEQARAEAGTSEKPILINFTGSDWCGWCIKLKDEVFHTAEFQEWAAENVILFEADFPRRKSLPAEMQQQNQALAQQYGIRGFPTLLLVDEKGKVLAKTGYVPGGPSAFINTVPLPKS